MKSLIFGLVALVVVSLSAAVRQASAAGEYDWMKAPQKGSNGSGGIGPYLTFKAGVFFPDDIDGMDMNTGTGAELGVGISPVSYFAAEVTAGYLETDNHDDNLNKYHLELRAIPVMLTAKAIAPLKIVDLYALAGVGFHYVMAERVNRSDPSLPTHESDDVVAAYHYGGGMRVRALLGALNVEVRMLEADKYSGIQLYGSLEFPF